MLIIFALVISQASEQTFFSSLIEYQQQQWKHAFDGKIMYLQTSVTILYLTNFANYLHTI